MITLTKLNTQGFALNSELIETIEETPDTVITMTNGNKYVVKETTQEVINKVIEFKKQIVLPVQS